MDLQIKHARDDDIILQQQIQHITDLSGIRIFKWDDPIGNLSADDCLKDLFKRRIVAQLRLIERLHGRDVGERTFGSAISDHMFIQHPFLILAADRHDFFDELAIACSIARIPDPFLIALDHRLFPCGIQHLHLVFLLILNDIFDRTHPFFEQIGHLCIDRIDLFSRFL